MASITLVRTVSFSIYQRAKYVYSGWVKENLGYDIIRHVNTPGTYPNLYSIACFGAAGATAGSAITFLACPFELTKLSAQVSVLLAERAGDCQKSRAVATSYQNKGTLKTMANIVKHRGILGLYTGFRLHLCTCLWALPADAMSLLTMFHSARYLGDIHLLHGVRERQATRDNLCRRQPEQQQAGGGRRRWHVRARVVGHDL